MPFRFILAFSKFEIDLVIISISIYRVIRPVFYDKISQAPKSTKSTKKHEKHQKALKSTTNLRFINLKFIDIRFIDST